MSRFILMVTIFTFLAACCSKKDSENTGNSGNNGNTADATTQPNPGDNAQDETKKNTAAQAACTCGAGKAGTTTWCEKCGVGYVKGEKTKDKAAVEAAAKGGHNHAGHHHGHDHHGHDHHGHDHGAPKAACTCGAGKAGGTVWCGKCGVGYIKGEKTKEKAAVAKALAGSTAPAPAPAPAK
ncbi:MAG: hypothetical protein CMH54_09840 [Myxococcales bacterium]|nr:hypothetical protein [Myxococcales bacterium]|tara:strand:+ start:1729 stop:2271 length:543 start_codon:yes stop_codon:yes gene_type:complete